MGICKGMLIMTNSKKQQIETKILEKWKKHNCVTYEEIMKDSYNESVIKQLIAITIKEVVKSK